MKNTKAESKVRQAKQTASLPPSSQSPELKEVALVVPTAFLNHDKKLTPENLRFAVELGNKFPVIVAASEELKSTAVEADAALSRMGQKYYSFCSALRSAKLNRRESSLLMRGLGFGKARISEILRVSEVSEAIWAKFKDAQIGFKAALALVRAEPELVADAAGHEPGEEGYQETPAPVIEPAPKKERRLPKEFAKVFADAMDDFGDSLESTGQANPYVFRYENAEKRTYVITIQPIDA